MVLIIGIQIIIGICLLYIILDKAIGDFKRLFMVFCPYCKKKIDKNARICPYCRSELKLEPETVYCAQCKKRIYFNKDEPCPECGSYWRKYGRK